MLQKRLMILPAICTLLLIVVCSTTTFASITGKIAGVVVDAKTNEPIMGATVRVVGTNLGTTTDIDGEYFIINVPSGKYNLIVTNIGFEPVEKTGVRVLVDLTTPLDFSLEPSAVQLGKKIVVHADAPVIQQDLTASKIIFTSDRLKTLPNISSVQSILTNYPGVVIDRDDGLHVRGGRTGQVSYYYDGFSVQDPFMANSGLRIMPTALEELSLTSGGYTAEYGEALSGIVSAITPEGTSTYHGRIRTYNGFTHPYNVNTGTLGDLKNIGNRSFAFNLSGPIPLPNNKRHTFFAAGEYLHDASYLPHNGIVSYNGTAKVTLRPTNKMKLKTNVTYYDADGEVYNHRDVNGRSYDFNLDGLPVFHKKAYLLGFSSDYAFNERVILTATANKFYTFTKSAPEDYADLYWTEWPGYSEDANGNYNGTIHENNYGNNRDFSDPMQLVGFTVGDDFDPTYRHRKTEYNAFHVNLMNQLDKWNQIKTGFEYRKYNIDWDFKQFYNPNPYGEKYTSKPTYASFYVQDKLEYDFFIINLGLRYDYHGTDVLYNATPQEQTPTYKKADSKSRISPRLGVSFPISEKSVMHFNYGLYYQTPRYTYMYTNLQGDISSGFPLLGNPNLEPEATTAYELGLNHLIGNDLRISAIAYYKDIEDLVTTRSSFKVAGNAVTYFDNDDYGTVKGFDFALEKLQTTSYFSGSISYSYMIARGNGSNALEPYYTYLTSTTDTLAPITEYPLDYDQRHTVTGVLNYQVPDDWQANLFGMKLPGAWGLTMVGYYGSGLPYTPTDQNGNRLGERNEGRLPAVYTVDMRFHKNFMLNAKDMKLSLFVEVDNLFNKRNVIDVYSRTGLPDNDGWNTQGGLSLNQQEVDRYDQLYDNDPQHYSPPRTIRTGLELNF